MYKILSVILLIILSMILLVGCDDKPEDGKIEGQNPEGITTEENIIEDSSIEPIYKEFDYDFDNSYAFSSIYEITGLTSNDVIPNAEAIESYDLADLEGATIEARKNSNYEVAVIKLKNTDQSTQLLKKISAKIQKMNVTEEEVAIEQNQGVLTLVIGQNASRVSNLFTRQFSDI